MENFSSRCFLQESRLTLIQNAAEHAFEEEPTLLLRHIIATKLTVLESNWIKFQQEHESICLENDHESLIDDPYFKLKTYERCQEYYIHARATLLTWQKESESSMRSSHSRRSLTPGSASQSHRVTVLRISLPQFDGDYQSWRPFHDLFLPMIVENSELSSVEKMQYLKSCLSGEASHLISNVPVSNNTFLTAWETLLARYETNRFLKTRPSLEPENKDMTVLKKILYKFDQQAAREQETHQRLETTLQFLQDISTDIRVLETKILELRETIQRTMEPSKPHTTPNVSRDNDRDYLDLEPRLTSTPTSFL